MQYIYQTQNYIDIKLTFESQITPLQKYLYWSSVISVYIQQYSEGSKKLYKLFPTTRKFCHYNSSNQTKIKTTKVKDH